MLQGLFMYTQFLPANKNILLSVNGPLKRSVFIFALSIHIILS